MRRTNTNFTKRLFLDTTKGKWYDSITAKITLLAWAVLLTSTIAYGTFYYLNQKKVIMERMQYEAKNISESIIHANGSAIFTDDYGTIIEFCSQLVATSKSLDYIGLKKRNSSSLVFTRDKWSYEEYGNALLDTTELDQGYIAFVKLINKGQFLLTSKFIYTGVNWGYLSVGISLDSYNQAMTNLITRIMLFSLVFIILGFIVALRFSRLITRPIIKLVNTTQVVEEGNLNVSVDIQSKDELGILANSFNSMISSLRKSTEQLENTVRERTHMLEETNNHLKEEILERKKAESSLKQYTLKLETLEEIYKGIISAESSEDVFYKTADIIQQKILQFTMAGLSIFDKERNRARVFVLASHNKNFSKESNEQCLDEYYGLNKRPDLPYCFQKDLTKIDTKNPYEQKIFDEGRISYISFPLHFQKELIGELDFGFDEPLSLENDKNNLIVEISHHISIGVMQMFLEEKLKQAALEMKTSLHEKEILLKEVHHRVKNNLQVISSLLYLQSKNVEDEKSLSVFKDSQMRVRSLALVHEKLYQSENLSKINFAEYVKNLASNIKSTYKLPTSEISMKFEFDDIHLTVDRAVTIGLLINELLTNAYKYAFPIGAFKDNYDRIVVIKMSKTEDSCYELLVSDNGVGFNEEINIETTKSLGLKIVSSLVNQLKGRLLIKNKNNTEFRITIPEE